MLRRRVVEEEVEGLITGVISKADDKRHIVFGWAYVTHETDQDNPYGIQIVDKSGQFVPDPEKLEDAAYKFVLNSRRGREFHGRGEPDDLSEIEKSGPISTLVESVVFTPEKCEEMGIPDGVQITRPDGSVFLSKSAWWVAFKVHNQNTWERYEKGELPNFSVHGTGFVRKVR